MTKHIYKKIEFKNILEVLKNHDHQNISECRFIFQALTSLRVSNTFDLQNNSLLQKKSCTKCKNRKSCKIPTDDCFPKLNILKTKTSTHSLPLIPFAHKCYKKLTLQTSTNQKIYANYLQKRFDSRSHLVRKFLPNFFYCNKNYSNTGNWTTDSKTMENHYLEKNSKYTLLFFALQNEIWSIGLLVKFLHKNFYKIIIPILY